MVSGKKGGGKISGKYLVSADDNMMNIQGLREMNLVACESDDWLMINNKNGFGAWNHPANQPQKAWGQPGMLNHPPKSWGQPAMLGLPGKTARSAPIPPNFVGNKHNGMMTRNPVGPPPWINVQGFNPRGGCDGNGIQLNGGSKRPLVVDSDDDHDDDDVEEDEESYSNGKAKNVTQSKGPIKGVHRSLTTNTWVHPGVGPKAYMDLGHRPSASSHPGVGYHGWRPAGGGVMPMPPSHFPAPPFPLPPLRPIGNFAAIDEKRITEKTGQNLPNKNSLDGTKYKFDDEFDEDLGEDWETEEDEDEDEDENIHKRRLDQNGRVVHGQVNLDPRLGMLPRVKNTRNLTHGGGDSQRQDKGVYPRVIPPSNSSPIGATSCKTRAKNAEKDVEILSDSESTDIEGDEGAEFDDNEDDEVVARPEFVNGKSEKSRKHMEENFAVKNISGIPKDLMKELKQSRKHHKERCGEATDICAHEQLQMKGKKVAEEPSVHVSFFEDYKNRVKEVAKLVKFHITSKPEVDTCGAEKEQLMKIHEEKLKMKKRHQQEEQELENQFAVALRRFMDKQTTVDTDSDASEL